MRHGMASLSTRGWHGSVVGKLCFFVEHLQALHGEETAGKSRWISRPRGGNV